MTPKQISDWEMAVKHHIECLDSIIEDRKSLKILMEEHLKTVFDWHEIEYNRDFSEITLKWKRDHHPIIRHENIKDFCMDWEISAEYDDSAFRIVVVKVYPFGIKERVES